MYKMFKFLVLLIATFRSVLLLSIANDLVITLPDGQIQGTTYVTQNNKTYYGFQGIPYATPPIGSLRFEAPEAPKPWTGVLDTSKDSKACISTGHWTNTNGESEDCLYLNVYTPSLKPSEKLPVMFWIYGGSFISGSSSKLMFGPDFLIEKDVIVVSFNYRLGPFGLLSTGDTAIRGNAALKDQSLAMRWTYENIALFGGDPEKITIFGQSAGGASAALHLLSKKSAGLYRAAVIESGSAINYWAIDRDPKSYAFLLADALEGGSYTGNDTQELKKLLKGKTSAEIINATILILAEKDRQVWPTLEVEDGDEFLSESPYELIKSGRFSQVPIVIGICSQESLLFLKDLDYATQLAELYDSGDVILIPTDLRPNTSDEKAVINAVRSIYLKEGETFSKNLVAFANLYGDNGFTRSVIKFAELSSSFVPVYLYQFAYYGRALSPAFIDGAEKAGHAAELPFIFNMSGVSDTTNIADILTQNRITQLWTNFVKFLNPTPEENELFDNVMWPTISSTNKLFLNINGTLELRSNLRGEAYLKWENIFETYGKKPFFYDRAKS